MCRLIIKSLKSEKEGFRVCKVDHRNSMSEKVRFRVFKVDHKKSKSEKGGNRVCRYFSENCRVQDWCVIGVQKYRFFCQSQKEVDCECERSSKGGYVVYL